MNGFIRGGAVTNVSIRGCGGEYSVGKQRSQSGFWGVKLSLERGGKNEKGRGKGKRQSKNRKMKKRRKDTPLDRQRKEDSKTADSTGGEGERRNGTGRGFGWLRKKKREILFRKGRRKGSHPAAGRKMLKNGKRGK